MIADIAIINGMKTKHTKTLFAIFTKSTRVTLEWSHIEAPLIELGCLVINGRGSRVRFVFNGMITAFHSPLPAKEAKPYPVEQTREFLLAIGVKP